MERRREFLEKADQLLSKNSSVLKLIKCCLHNDPAQRPRTVELVTRLQEMNKIGGFFQHYVFLLKQINYAFRTSHKT